MESSTRDRLQAIFVSANRWVVALAVVALCLLAGLAHFPLGRRGGDRERVHPQPGRRHSTSQYQIEVGMYLLETGERLPLIEEREVVGDRILLEPAIIVK